MSKDKLGKVTRVATSEKLRQDGLFVRGEGELAEVQWEAIVDGLIALTNLYAGFKEELMSQQTQEKFTAAGAPQKTPTEALYPN